jgi:SpoVK/Ycf46/Vps4 family AAA+-type ATPase
LVLTIIQEPGKEYFILPEDVEQAFRLVKPSAMHDITLQPPPIRWNEIGGQDTVKQDLRQALEDPLKVSSQACGAYLIGTLAPIFYFIQHVQNLSSYC